MAEAEPVYTGQETAVIGIALRINRAATSEEFWDKLKNGVELISFYTEEELIAAGQNPGSVRNPGYVKAGLILEDKEYFDAAFFGYTPREAELLDPQVRLFHECSWQALEDAGIDPGEYPGLIGVYAGAVQNLEWEARVLISGKANFFGNFGASRLTGIRYLCARLSYNLNLKGPSISMQTSCSTSLVAIHLACQALLGGECDVAIAGGVTVSARKKQGYLYEENMILSSDGHNRTFDARATGTIFGEGAGVVILKPLEDALTDNDNIYAIIRGSAVNNDGNRKIGFTAPSVEAQVEMMRAAYHLAGIEPGTIGLMEAHGTATQLGDPIEVEALKQAFDTGTGKKGHCWLGSVKTNTGHLDAAAGVVGFIKAVLAIKNRQIPPSLYFEIPNPELNLIDSPFVINTVLTPWEREDYPLRAAVNSLGMGGTNAHIVLEEAPAREESPKSHESQLILLSARTRSSLEAAKKNLADFLEKNMEINLADVAYTLQTRRRTHPYRAALVCSRVEEAIRALSGLENGKILENDPASHGTKNNKKIETGIEKNIPEPGLLLERVGKPWLYGEKIDWDSFYAEEKRHCISLPPYAFDRQRYWIEDIPMEIPGTGRGAAKRENLREWFYTVSWSRTDRLELKHHQEKDRDQYNWLLFLDDSHMQIGTQLQKRLEPHSRRIITVEMGNGWSNREEGRYIINPGEKTHYDRLLAALEESGQLPRKILHLWGITGNRAAVSVEEGQNRGFYSLIYLAQAISRCSSENQIEIIVVTDHMQKVTGTETISPIKSTVLGPVYVIPQEYINIQCRSIDISLSKPGGPGYRGNDNRPQEQTKGDAEAEALTRQLIPDFFEPAPAKVTAYRNGSKWKQAFEPIKFTLDSLNGVMKEHGVYMITGGLGGVGLLLAEEFARSHKARLVLTGRSRLPDRQEWDNWLETHGEHDALSYKIKKIRGIEKIGGQVDYFNADVSDFEEMNRVKRRVEEKYASINGLIHAAGGTKGESIALIRDLDPGKCRHQFNAKINGLLVLDRLFKNENSDFRILTSSMTSFLGGWEYAAYAAANFFLDSFAQEARGWICIDLDILNIHGDKNAETTLDTREILQTFNRVMANVKSGQVLVSITPLKNRIEKATRPLQDMARESLAEDRGHKQAASLFSRPDLTTPYVPPDDEIQEGIVEICRELFGYDKIGILDNFFELGGTSLTVIAFISKIRQRFAAAIRIQDVFEKRNIREISEEIKRATREEESILDPTEKKSYYPLAAQQKGMYFLWELDKQGISYNLIQVFVTGNVIVEERLERIFKRLVKRHEILRSSIEIPGNEPVLRIHEEIEFSLESYDISGETNGELQKKREEALVQGFDAPFNLLRPPLFRIGLIKSGETRYILLVSIHHIISDQVSHNILMHDFVTLYNGGELAPLKLQYKDYAEWQNSEERQILVKQQEEFWLKIFAGGTPVLDLETDFPRPNIQSVAGDFIKFSIGARETNALKEIATGKKATLFMVLLAIYNILLARLSRKEDIVVGTATANRNNVHLEKIVGFFINILVLRNFPTPEKTFMEFLTDVRQNTLNAFANQDYPFEELVHRVAQKMDLSRRPLFDAAFTFGRDSQSGGREEFRGQGADLELVPYFDETKISNVDITLAGAYAGEELTFNFEYCTKLFKEETIRGFIDAFKRIVTSVVENPGQKIKDILLISREKSREISSRIKQARESIRVDFDI